MGHVTHSRRIKFLSDERAHSPLRTVDAVSFISRSELDHLKDFRRDRVEILKITARATSAGH